MSRGRTAALIAHTVFRLRPGCVQPPGL